MKTPIKSFLAFVTVCLFTAAAWAAEATPAGTWKWTQQGRQGGQGSERAMKLELKDGKLTGKLLGWKMGDNDIPESEITGATFKDGVVAFAVTREFNGNTFTMKYSAKLEGDKLTGSIESPGRDGQTMKRDWTATRAK